MKNLKVLIVVGLCVGLMAASFSGCSNNDKKSNDKATEASTKEEVKYDEIAKEKIVALNDLELICSGAIKKSDEVAFTKDSIQYSKVTDSRFNSRDDLKNFLSSNVSKNAATRYDGINDEKQFVELKENNEFNVEKGLYVAQAGKGCYSYSTEDIKVSDEKEDSFTATTSYDNFGAPATLTIKIVKDGNNWLVDNIDLGQ